MLQPDRDCRLCPRLAAFRSDNRARFPDFHNAPVASFGAPTARLLVVGLAPGLRGANRTGRPFTGDYAGDVLYPTLLKFGFARGCYAARRGDGLTLVDCRITNAIRCVPPENKPIGAEVTACRRFLQAEFAAMANLAVIVALGGLAHAAVLAALGCRRSRFPFVHGAAHTIDAGARPLVLRDSYHCSRYNTNTGKLTTDMFEAVFDSVRRQLAAD